MTKLQNRRAQLTAAFNKTQQILQEFAAGYRSPDNWNHAHDLQYRIYKRYTDNEIEIGCHLFETDGIHAISSGR